MPKSTRGTVNGAVPERSKPSPGTSSSASAASSGLSGDSVLETEVSHQSPAPETELHSETTQRHSPELKESVASSSAGTAAGSIPETGSRPSSPSRSSAGTTPTKRGARPREDDSG